MQQPLLCGRIINAGYKTDIMHNMYPNDSQRSDRTRDLDLFAESFGNKTGVI